MTNHPRRAREPIHYGLGIEIFIAPNNDGTGRSDWHVSNGSDCYGGFRRLSEAKEVASRLFQEALASDQD